MVAVQPAGNPLSPYLSFDRDTWSALRAATPLTLDEQDLDALRGINEHLSLEEVTDIYLPLSRLLNLYVSASQDLSAVTDTFLGSLAPRVPYVIGIAGSVAVGKSTTARILQTLLSRWPHHPKVDLITTDGFLFPNAVLEERGIMSRKGFPESYDVRRLVQFMAEVKSGKEDVEAPIYSHIVYDIVAGETQVVRQPRHRDRRGPERAAVRELTSRHRRLSADLRVRLLRLLDLRRRGGSARRAVVPGAVPSAAGDGLP